MRTLERLPPPLPRDAGSSPGSRWLPGDRRVWVAAGITGLVFAILILAGMAQGREPYTGSNSVYPRDALAIVPARSEVCVERVRIPSGTGRVRVALDTRGAAQPAFAMTVTLWASPNRRGAAAGRLTAARPASSATGFQRVDFALNRDVPAGPGGFRMADVCLESRGGGLWYPWGRTLLGISDRPLRIEGQDDVPARLSLWFLDRADDERSMLAQLPTVFERASLFRPGPVGPWTFWIVFFGALPALFYAGVRILARAAAGEAGRLGPAVAVGLVALGSFSAWAVVTPPFQTPDESEHFAAVQYFAETGRAVDAALVPERPVPWSSQELVAIDATRQQTTFERPGAQLPWLRSYELAFAARLRPPGAELPRDNGGGFHPATSSHTPFYYALASPAYLTVGERGPFTQLLAVRLFAALLGALTVALAVLAVRELAPGRPLLAATAGLLVAFQPMFGFMSGAVNNDSGVNLAAAALIYLCVRGLRRGLDLRTGLAIGAVLALAPLLKGTAYALYPPVLLALGFMVLRGRARIPRTAIAAAGVAAAFGVVYLAWGRISEEFQRTVYATPGGGAPTGVAGLQDLNALASWLWQIFVPLRLPFMTDFTIVKWPFYDIYIREGFGAFGWYAIKFPEWVYLVVLLTMAVVGALGLRALWERRGRLPSRAGELLFLLAVPVCVLGGVETAYLTITDLPLDGTPEQGRYAFPAITAVAALAACALLGAGRRRALVAGVLVTALMGMTLGGQLLQLQSFYT